MGEHLEIAKEHMEHAGHAAHGGHGGGHDDGSARYTAMLVAVLAAALALCEMGEKGAQNAYLTHHIKASDDWAVYQTKTVRMNMYAMFADTWEATPGFDEKKIAAARANAKRMDDEPGGNGRKQMEKIAKESEHEREEAFHRYHSFEFSVGGLQIAIVLASVSVVTRVKALAMVAGVMGAGAVAYAAAAMLHLV